MDQFLILICIEHDRSHWIQSKRDHAPAFHLSEINLNFYQILIHFTFKVKATASLMLRRVWLWTVRTTSWWRIGATPGQTAVTIVLRKPSAIILNVNFMAFCFYLVKTLTMPSTCHQHFLPALSQF